MLKLKRQYFCHLIRRTDSIEKTLMLGKIEGGRRRGRQRMRWLGGITNSMDMSMSNLWELVMNMSLSKLWELVMDMSLGKLGVGDGQGGLSCCSSWGHKELNTTERLN